MSTTKFNKASTVSVKNVISKNEEEIISKKRNKAIENLENALYYLNNVAEDVEDIKEEVKGTKTASELWEALIESFLDSSIDEIKNAAYWLQKAFNVADDELEGMTYEENKDDEDDDV